VSAVPTTLVRLDEPRVSSVVYQKTGMVTAHTTMQYGHSARMSYRLAAMSQCTNTTPNVAPACMPRRNQRGGVNPPSIAAPVVATTANAAMPMSGFGNPNAAACGLSITEPHEMTGLSEQVGTYDGSMSFSIFSSVRAAAAASPIRPPTR
jgi:hypothetical protein